MVWRKFNSKDIFVNNSYRGHPGSLGKKKISKKRLRRKIRFFYRGERYSNVPREELRPVYGTRVKLSLLSTERGCYSPYPNPLPHRSTSKTPRPVAFRVILNSSNTAPFRSYWFSRFVNIFISRGKKTKALNYLFRVFGILKTLHGRTPSILVFEVLEAYRLPFSVIVAKRNKGYNRVHLLAWWKQYGQVLKWFRHAFKRKTVRSSAGWEHHLLSEFEQILSGNPTSAVQKRRSLLVQLAAAGRIYSHFRWKKNVRRAEILI